MNLNKEVSTKTGTVVILVTLVIAIGIILTVSAV